jgi:hypothetical protein
MWRQMLGRSAAALVALTAAAGLGVQYFAVLAANGSMLANLWILARFFTILTNALVVGVFGWVALTGRPAPRIVAGTALSILLVGVVYGALLHGLNELTPAGNLANVLLHMVTPALAPLYWLALTRKGDLRWRDLALWTAWPVAYVVYALARGAADGRYPYPFIDVARIGWARTAANCAAISAGYLIAGVAVVWLDHRLARRPTAAI